MTCDDALTIMLAADLAELAPGHLGPVGQHLVGCGRCRRVASQLQADSSRLAAAVRLPASEAAPIRRQLPLPWMFGLAATAAIAIVAVATRAPTGGSSVSAADSVSDAGVGTQAATPTPRVTTPVPPAVARAPQRPAAQPDHVPRATPAVAFDVPTSVVAAPFEPPTPVHAVPLEAEPVLAMNVSVAPRVISADNDNVRLLHSPDPNITVLWFH